MGKRFTDSKKWRNEWFRTLPDKAKLVWIYLCDECDKAGVLKLDWGLASFQLGFKVNADLVHHWLGDKVHFFDDDKILIVQFFEFQYGQSKDTWSAKIEARNQLEALGFSIVNNKVLIPNQNDSPPTVGDSVPTTLIRVRGRVRVNNKEIDENLKNEILRIYARYPLKKGKEKGVKALLQELTLQDIPEFERAVEAYRTECEREKKSPKFIQHFSTFVTHWREFSDPEYGKSDLLASDAWDVMTAPLRGM